MDYGNISWDHVISNFVIRHRYRVIERFMETKSLLKRTLDEAPIVLTKDVAANISERMEVSLTKYVGK